MEFRDIAAVVTGGASGLGAATARALAKLGAKVAIFGMNAGADEAIATDIKAVFARVDVTDDASVDAGFAWVRDIQGQERLLINCAGIRSAAKTAGRSKSDASMVTRRNMPAW